MATTRLRFLSSLTPTKQLNLPLGTAATAQPIHLREVWATLSPPQQAQLHRQLVSICCRLINRSQREVPDEPH
jgi:hypothetical protein